MPPLTTHAYACPYVRTFCTTRNGAKHCVQPRQPRHESRRPRRANTVTPRPAASANASVLVSQHSSRASRSIKVSGESVRAGRLEAWCCSRRPACAYQLFHARYNSCGRQGCAVCVCAQMPLPSPVRPRCGAAAVQLPFRVTSSRPRNLSTATEHPHHALQHLIRVSRDTSDFQTRKRQRSLATHKSQHGTLVPLWCGCCLCGVDFVLD